MAANDQARPDSWWRRHSNALFIAATAGMAAALLASMGIDLARRPAPAPIAGHTVLIEFAGGIGSGVYIGNGYYLTAAHVATAAPELKLKTDTGLALEPKLLWAAKDYDIALLRVEHPAEQRAAILHCESARVGDTVRLEGSPLGWQFIRTEGRIAANSAEGRPAANMPWKSVQIVNATLLPGMSGGPVLDTAGRLVGINVGVVMAGNMFTASPVDLGFIVPSSIICGLLARGAA